MPHCPLYELLEIHFTLQQWISQLDNFLILIFETHPIYPEQQYCKFAICSEILCGMSVVHFAALLSFAFPVTEHIFPGPQVLCF